ncbi:unnamed protein product [Gordionus sp. m RMFG-2023]|uniref:glycogen debranching enzyme-like n=1 Tax=Gordionus sp. m RMFG-2023 TaxID=3053472 RepID=UPI0030E11D17
MASFPIGLEYTPPGIVYIHQLNYQENLETKLFRLQKGAMIHFKLGPSLFGKVVHLYCNHPSQKPETGESSQNPLEDSFSRNFEPFERGTFYELPWVKRSIYHCDETDTYAELELGRSGSFRYYFVICDAEHVKLHPLLENRTINEAQLNLHRLKWMEYRQSQTLEPNTIPAPVASEADKGSIRVRYSLTEQLQDENFPLSYRFPMSDDTTGISSEDFEGDGCGYFLVDPTLTVGPDSDPLELTLDALRCQTILAKSLGRFDQWPNRILTSVRSGYNAIHLTPVQELGISNSAYCVKDHFKLNPIFYVPLNSSISKLSLNDSSLIKDDSQIDLVNGSPGKNGGEVNIQNKDTYEDEGKEDGEKGPKHRMSRSMSLSKSNRRPATLEELENLIAKMQVDWGLLSFQDVVWNHAATNCQWIWDHPECGYNLINSPYMKPAYLIDRALWHFTLQVSKGEWSHRNVPRNIRDEFNLNAIRAILLDTAFPKLKIYEFYITDVEKVLGVFRAKIIKMGGPNPKEVHQHMTAQDFARKARSISHSSQITSNTELELLPHPHFARMGSSVDMKLALAIFNKPHQTANEADRIEICCNEFRNKLHNLNHAKWEEMESHLRSAAEAVVRNCRYYYLDGNGPKWPEVSMETPIVYKYFTHPYDDMPIEREEVEIINDSEKGLYIMAHNGWVMNDDPLKNFAGPDSNVFLRRELLVWGDNVKLRYGETYRDNPFLWDTMKKYTESVAKIFHGIRIDNCHSTPLGVGEFLIDAARNVRPNLYVMAELFTQSEATDNIFVNRFGITSLIREAMAAWNAKELGRLEHRYGGTPVGSFLPPPTRRLTPQLAHAILMDQTHDNPSLIEARSVYNVLPLSAVVCMACSAIGSTRGLDEMFPNKIDIVNDNRKYRFWMDKEDKIPHKAINMSTGIIAAKRILNLLHQEMALEHYDQIFVDQIDEDVIAITRHSPLTHKSIILVAYTVFKNIGNTVERHDKYIKPLTVPGIVEEIILEANLEYCPQGKGEFKQDSKYMNGLADYKLNLRTNIQFYGSEMIEYQETGQSTAAIQDIDFVKFYPGSVIAFRVNLNATSRSAILQVRKCLSEFGYNPRSYSGTEIVFDPKSSSFSKMILGSCGPEFLSQLEEIQNNSNGKKNVDLTNSNKTGQNNGQNKHDQIGIFLTQVVNKTLYKCDPEERADTDGKIGVYNIPSYGPFVYCGILSIAGLLRDIRLSNDLGHPLCENLRKGNWLQTYIAERLKISLHTKCIGIWFENAFNQLNQIPRYLIPFYFEALINGASRVIIDTSIKSLSRFINRGTPFAQGLALSSLALVGQVKNAPLPLLSANPVEQAKEIQMPSISAGLPHFSHGIFRIWGRDTFISFRGLMLLTGRFEEGRHLILAFARALRHGLMPNLLGEGICARYNCRDAVWWWLQSIQDYCEIKNFEQVSANSQNYDKNFKKIVSNDVFPENYSILKDKVSRIYPEDDSEPQEMGKYVQPISDIIQEVLQKHAQGLAFRERNAGPNVDSNMSSEGFNNSIGVDWKTGFVYGGTVHNCGTWMDKMGSSDLAKNKGIPATPRDGAAVEIVALCKSALNWLIKIKKLGYYPYDSVKVHKQTKINDNKDRTRTRDSKNQSESESITLEKWSGLIAQNFEKKFYIPTVAKFLSEGEEIYDTDGHKRPSIMPVENNADDDSENASSEEEMTSKKATDKSTKILRPNGGTKDGKENKYINRRGVYKDTYGSSQPWADYQLRCNFPVAMILAPELFSNEKAWKALKIVEDILLGPLGIKTLDPTDWAYNGFYDNDNNSNDYNLAHGFNYHQGPEWLWPVGYFFRSKLYFAKSQNNPTLYSETVDWVKQRLSAHYEMLRKPPWYGLPELTQENGRECHFGCPIQAWSTSSILETLFDMRH